MIILSKYQLNDMCGKKNSEKKSQFFKFKKAIEPTNLPDTSQMF